MATLQYHDFGQGLPWLFGVPSITELSTETRELPRTGQAGHASADDDDSLSPRSICKLICSRNRDLDTPEIDISISNKPLICKLNKDLLSTMFDMLKGFFTSDDDQWISGPEAENAISDMKIVGALLFGCP